MISVVLSVSIFVKLVEYMGELPAAIIAVSVAGIIGYSLTYIMSKSIKNNDNISSPSKSDD